jgi:hypothetical protein
MPSIGEYTKHEIKILEDLIQKGSESLNWPSITGEYNKAVPLSRKRTKTGLRKKAKSLGLQEARKKRKNRNPATIPLPSLPWPILGEEEAAVEKLSPENELACEMLHCGSPVCPPSSHTLEPPDS